MKCRSQCARAYCSAQNCYISVARILHTKSVLRRQCKPFVLLTSVLGNNNTFDRPKLLCRRKWSLIGYGLRQLGNCPVHCLRNELNFKRMEALAYYFHTQELSFNLNGSEIVLHKLWNCKYFPKMTLSVWQSCTRSSHLYRMETYSIILCSAVNAPTTTINTPTTTPVRQPVP